MSNDKIKIEDIEAVRNKLFKNSEIKNTSSTSINDVKEIILKSHHENFDNPLTLDDIELKIMFMKHFDILPIISETQFETLCQEKLDKKPKIFAQRVKKFFNRMDNRDKEAVMNYFYVKKPVTSILATRTAPENAIPCLAVYEYFSNNDDTRVKGGTDIVLRYPLELEAISNPPPTEITTSSRWNIYGVEAVLERADQWRYRLLDPINRANLEVKPKQISIRITKPITRKDQWRFFWYGVFASFFISVVVGLILQLIKWRNN